MADMHVYPYATPPPSTPHRDPIAGQRWSEAHVDAAPQCKHTCAPEVRDAAVFTLSKRVNLTLYGVAMVTDWLQSVPEAKES